MVQNIIDMSVKEIYNNWTINIKEIIEELTGFVYNINKYSNNFNNIDDPNEWWVGIINIFKELYNILTKKERGMYVGILIILISVMMYFIQITS